MGQSALSPGDAAKVFELAKEALDEGALAVGRFAEAWLLLGNNSAITRNSKWVRS